MLIPYFFSLIRSTINIPVKEAESEYLYPPQITFWGIKYNMPHIKKAAITVNFGGAIIPITISFYEILRVVFKNNYTFLTKYLFIFFAICYFFAKPVRGIGIAMPALIPPLISALLGIFMGGNPAVIAYTSGTLGTLIELIY